MLTDKKAADSSPGLLLLNTSSTEGSKGGTNVFAPSVDTATLGGDISTLWDVKEFKIVVTNYGKKIQ